MLIKNSDTAFGLISKIFHWVMGLMMIFLLFLGLTMMGIEPSPEKWQAYGLHKSLGILVLALVVLRLIWKYTTKQPHHIETHKPWEKRLASIIQLLLYAGMIFMPLSGWVMSSAGGHAISFFGLFEVPPLVEKNKEIGTIAHEIHEIAGTAIILAIGLHFLGAAKHHLLDKDATLHQMSVQNKLLATLFLAILGGAVAIPTYYAIQNIIAENQKEKIKEEITDSNRSNIAKESEEKAP